MGEGASHLAVSLTLLTAYVLSLADVWSAASADEVLGCACVGLYMSRPVVFITMTSVRAGTKPLFLYQCCRSLSFSCFHHWQTLGINGAAMGGRRLFAGCGNRRKNRFSYNKPTRTVRLMPWLLLPYCPCPLHANFVFCTRICFCATRGFGVCLSGSRPL